MKNWISKFLALMFCFASTAIFAVTSPAITATSVPVKNQTSTTTVSKTDKKTLPIKQNIKKPSEPLSKTNSNESQGNKETQESTEATETPEAMDAALQTNGDRLNQRFQEFTQNRDNPVGSLDWFKYIRVGGLLNVEAFNQTAPLFQTGGTSASSSRQISLATAKLNVDASVNEWVRGHIGLFYSDLMRRYYLTNTSQNNSTTHGVVVDEGYVTIANFERSPFFLRAGQQYLPFGVYNRYPITKTLTQSLSETRAVAAEIGFNDKSGLAASVSAFDGLAKRNQSNHLDIDNYIAAILYENRNHPVGFNVGLSYINNMADVGDISNNITASTYVRRVGGVDAHFDVFTGPFSFMARFVSAMRAFSTTDFSYQVRPGTVRGAKPKAVTLQTGYAFQTYQHESQIQLSYQLSREARNANGSSTALALPYDRWSVGYGIKLLKNTIVAAEFRRDHDYAKKNSGTNRYDNAGTLRLTVIV